jgi:hypothetical protein
VAPSGHRAKRLISRSPLADVTSPGSSGQHRGAQAIGERHDGQLQSRQVVLMPSNRDGASTIWQESHMRSRLIRAVVHPQ